MANILSQDEVDALLSAVEQGDLDGSADDEDGLEESVINTVVEYNFRRPNLLTKEQLRGFNSLHENFSREVQAMLSLHLRTATDFKLVSIDQQQYNEFILSLANISHLTLFEIKPLLGLAVIEVNLSLVFGIVDLLLGGQGDVETETRKLTEVEVAIVEPLLKNMIRQLEASWNIVIPVKIQPTRNESNPEYVQAAPSDAPVVVLTFDVKVGLANGIVNLCYPLPMVQSLMDQMSGKSGQFDNYYGKANADDSRKKMLMAMMDVPMYSSVTLGQARIATKDLLTLAPGDVVVLDKTVHDPVSVMVGRKPCFTARPGQRKRSLAVKISEWITHDVNEEIGNLLK